jgi:hypothetical protein
MVATGLGFVYAGLCLLVFSILSPLILAFTTKDLRLVVMVPLGLLLVATVLDIIGRLMCLAMPADRSGSRPIIFVSVLCSLAVLAISAWTLGVVFLDLPAPPEIAGMLSTPVAVLGSVLFVIFLRNLALDVQQPQLASRAIMVLVLGMVIVLGFMGFKGYYILMSRGGPNVAGGGFGGAPAVSGVGLIVVLVLFVLGITTLILYGNLLTYLRTKVAAYAANPPRVPVPEGYAAPAPGRRPSDAVRPAPEKDIQEG